MSSTQPTNGPLSTRATAKVWATGKSWAVHAKHPETGAWIRVHGLDTETEAIWEGDALCAKLEQEAEALGV